MVSPFDNTAACVGFLCDFQWRTAHWRKGTCVCSQALTQGKGTSSMQCCLQEKIPQEIYKMNKKMIDICKKKKREEKNQNIQPETL
jgi:hypothetical protein